MSETPHVVLAAPPSWSHLRTLSVFAAKLVAERRVVVTFVLPNLMNYLGKVEAEVERALQDVAAPQGIFRAIVMGEAAVLKMTNPAEISKICLDAVQPLWEAFKSGSELTCSLTGKTYPGAAPPSVALIDGFLQPWYSIARLVLPDTPILTWASGTASGTALSSLPARFGGKLDNGETGPSGKIVKLPGLPEMYDWELAPQDIPIKATGAQLEALFVKATQESDGLATPCTPDFDGEEVLRATDQWLAETGRVAFNLGPLMPFKAGTNDFSSATLEAELKAAPPGVGETVIKFLDNALATRGKESVVYIGFGHFFWPAHNIEHLWALLEALAQRDIPFILSQGSPLAQIPDHIKDLYKDATKGLIVPWSPQQSVMAHKAVGWFVTHGGAGGTMDAVTQGVPMIGWPFVGDQPGNIAYLTHTLDVAFTLYETRTGEDGLKPILATGKTPTGTLAAFKDELKQLLDDMAGEAGARKRRNVKQRQGLIAKSWGEGGRSRKELQAFCTKYGL